MSEPAIRTDPGDAAFARELEVALPRVRAFARSLRAATNDADDLMQETLARAWRYRTSRDADAELVPWLMRIAFRVALDDRQRSSRLPRSADLDHEVAPDRGCSVELRDEVERLLVDLDPIERELVLGMHRDGKSIAELSEQFAMPPGTVKSHLHRARGRLRRRVAVGLGALALVVWLCLGGAESAPALPTPVAEARIVETVVERVCIRPGRAVQREERAIDLRAANLRVSVTKTWWEPK